MSVEQFCENQMVFQETEPDTLDCVVRIIEGGVKYAKCPYATVQDAVEGRVVDGERKYVCRDYEPLEPKTTLKVQ